MLYLLHRYAEAIEVLESALERHPEFWRLHFNVALPYLAVGRAADACSAMERAWNLQSTYPTLLAVLAATYAAAGRVNDAESLRAQLLATTDYVSPFWMGVFHACLDRYDDAISWMRRAHHDREWFLILGPRDRLLSALRQRSSFCALLEG